MVFLNRGVLLGAYIGRRLFFRFQKLKYQKINPEHTLAPRLTETYIPKRQQIDELPTNCASL